MELKEGAKIDYVEFTAKLVSGLATASQEITDATATDVDDKIVEIAKKLADYFIKEEAPKAE